MSIWVDLFIPVIPLIYSPHSLSLTDKTISLGKKRRVGKMRLKGDIKQDSSM